MTSVLRLACAGVTVEIECAHESTLAFLRVNFGAMWVDADGDPELRYRVDAGTEGARMRRVGSEVDTTVATLGDLVYALESDLVVQLQLLRPQLVFLHAAALERDGRVYLLVGPSGAGKSTTCWGLLHHGFAYRSDEMAPVALDSGTVLGYAHALCLKDDPPVGYPAPERAWRTSRGIHIPPEVAPPPGEGAPLGGFFFVQHRVDATRSSVRGMGTAEAATRLYPNILNALAHGDDGLAAAIRLASGRPAYRLESVGLADTCRLVVECVDALAS